MKEVILYDEHSLNDVIKTLNQLFIKLNKCGKEKEQFLKNFTKCFSVPNTANLAWQCIKKETKKFEVPSDVGSVLDPYILFKNFELTPYIGSIKNGVMFCEGMTIGLKMILAKKAEMSYRLDYAPDKGLHFNFEIVDNHEKYPLCIKLRFSTSRFGFSLKDQSLCENNPKKTSTFLQAIKLKFWLKMSIAHTLVSKKDLGTDNTQTPDEQLLNFVRGNKKYNFDTVKEHIVSLLPNDEAKGNVNNSNEPKDLFEYLMKEEMIRAKTRESIFITIANKDDSRRLLENHHFLQDADQTDSEKRIDSEQPPKLAK